MRDERHPHRLAACLFEARQDLGRMAMPGHRIGFEVIGRFGEKYMDFGLAPSPAHTGFGIGYEMCVIDDTGLNERQKAELDGGGVAPGVADDTGSANLLPVELRQSVHRLAKQLRTAIDRKSVV